MSRRSGRPLTDPGLRRVGIPSERTGHAATPCDTPRRGRPADGPERRLVHGAGEYPGAVGRHGGEHAPVPAVSGAAPPAPRPNFPRNPVDRLTAPVDRPECRAGSLVRLLPLPGTCPRCLAGAGLHICDGVKTPFVAARSLELTKVLEVQREGRRVGQCACRVRAAHEPRVEIPVARRVVPGGQCRAPEKYGTGEDSFLKCFGMWREILNDQT